MKELLDLLNRMRSNGVISDYALFGAAAQMRYTEPIATLDVDILIELPSADRLDVLAPIYEFCRKSGYTAKGEAIQVGAWPVQFIPVFDSLTKDALEQADTADLEGVQIRVVRANYLALIALSVGRAKDYARILAMLESGSVTQKKIKNLAEKYGLLDAWNDFRARFLTRIIHE